MDLQYATVVGTGQQNLFIEHFLDAHPTCQDLAHCASIRTCTVSHCCMYGCIGRTAAIPDFQAHPD